MKTKKIIFFILTVILISTFLSCSKSNTEHKLQGTWKVIDVSNIYDTTWIEKWQFSTGNKLKIYATVNGVDDLDHASNLTYKTTSYKKVLISSSDSTNYSHYCREWDILELKKDILIMSYTHGGIYQKEFEKM